MSFDQPAGSADHIPVVVEVQKGTVSGWLEISLSDGSFFMLPAAQLYSLGWEQPGTPVVPAEAAEKQSSAWLTCIRQKAMDSLARAEQCRAHLERKMRAKGYPAEPVRIVLDDLQQRDLLSDLRFARLWARNRMLRRGEGPVAVSAGLRSRGVPAHIVRQALEDIQEEIPDILDTAIARAVSRLLRLKSVRGRETLRYRLLNEGFDAELIAEELKKRQI